MDNTTKFREWILTIYNGGKPGHATCQALVAPEFWLLHTNASKGMVFLGKKGIKSIVSGVGDIRKNGFELRAAGQAFKILPPPAHGKKGVTDTSREAYASLDKSGQALKVAEAVIELHRVHPYVSDTLVGRACELPEGRVSARRNEIEALGAITVHGRLYHFNKSPKKIKCPVTGSTVNGWQLVLPSSLF